MLANACEGTTFLLFLIKKIYLCRQSLCYEETTIQGIKYAKHIFFSALRGLHHGSHGEASASLGVFPHHSRDRSRNMFYFYFIFLKLYNMMKTWLSKESIDLKQYHYKYKALKYYLKNKTISKNKIKIKAGSENEEVKTYDNGDRYEGEWKDGKRHGQGTLYYKSGSRYEGEWKDGKRHGQGTFFWNDGDRYEGEWKDDWKHGKGTMYLKDGRRY
jgi:hypothetical protein